MGISHSPPISEISELLKYLTTQEAEELDYLLTIPTTKSFTEFKQSVWKSYQNAKHQQAIDTVLEQIAEYILSGGTRGIKRAMIFMPPRHGKTKSVSHYFPAWMLGLMPDLRVIMASYGAALAHRNSKVVRNLIENPDYQAQFPDTKLSSDTTAKNEWDTTKQGGAIAVGVDGSVTGSGGKLIILDDVVKSRAEAESEVYRQKTIDWYVNDLLTRLEEPNGAIILMMTRWHMGDLAGYLLENEPDDWHVLNLPALANENDPLGRDVGEALWPEVYSKEFLLHRRERQGEYAFSSLYQQSPMPSKAGLFDVSKITIVDSTPAMIRMVRFYDLAVTAKKYSDYTVGLKLGIDKDENIYILHVYRVQKTPVHVEADILQNAQLDGRDTHIRLEAEKAGIVQLDYLLRNSHLRGFRLDAKAPEGDKYTRAQPIASRVNAGKVFMVRGEWNRAFLDECAVFPMGAHDDQVDAFSGAYDAASNGASGITVRRYA
jgi:predicted phage terminase large subunit-like protein